MSACACAECAPRVPRREHDERDVIAPSVPDDELARWTGVGTGSLHDARAVESGVAAGVEVSESGSGEEPDLTAAQLHAALAVVVDLLACLDPRAHTWPPQQQAIWRARELLREHGVAAVRL